MRVLIGCLLTIVLSGCIPIGLAGRTSAIDAPGPATGAAASSAAPTRVSA
jgi:hypothetical protein